ncbi:Eco57I restriction-modification methylase domain-containing protein [Mesonia mobilis]|uniref:site-specific DNA-methyltransferase (adenine-specific) n=1 Tax=Mesonia mobilis TaxID=369791 RepID=A0ABQ3BHV9_9FLAO|nr:N-6 DNA methylase [Mesonia mobilis]MBQ0737505.1 N-6 DNA methylase [Aquimarina celericrescens]GGZ45967.1 type II endonuclease-methyltransferasefusion protein [Mesonia mobilis]
MALFQTSVLKKYLKAQDQNQISKAYRKFSKYFLDPKIQENIKSSKEEEYQGIFLTELFVKVLDYTMKPNANYNLVAEYKNQTNSRKADGAILKENIALGVIELKGTNTKHLEGIRQQAFDYKANQKGCVYVITSNFEKLRFYINDATEFLEFDLFSLTEDRFALLYLCLQQDNFLSGLPLEIKEASLVEESQITKGFYKDYSVFKRELYRDLVRNNAKKLKAGASNVISSEFERSPEELQEQQRLEKNVKLTLFKKSQKLIDRFLFIFFAEDRGLLPPNAILQIIEDWNKLKDLDVNQPLYERFKLYFSYLDTGRKGTDKKAEIFAYNGGLFKPDAILDLLEINDELLYKHTAKLSAYDFESQVDVNILGHIFENSLNEIESVNAEIEGDNFDKQKSKRKKDGVFYTPKYITKYIVENTVGKLCEEKKTELEFREEEYFEVKKGTHTATKKKLLATLDTYRDWLLQLTICDPACGSGAFLNQALEFLIAEHAYIDELKAKVLGGAIVFSDIENTILENNIYGVDINEESVEIAKLSLWLRTAQPRRKLNDLSSNIKCGNSLIDAKSVAGDKAFKWEEEFPAVFDKGGFDVVIGNPPYLSTKEIDNKSKTFFKAEFQTAIGQFDLYGLFIEKSYKILRDKGVFSFITSNTFLSNKDFIVLRKMLLSKTKINTLVNLGETVFEDANLDVAIIGFRKVIDNKGSILIIKNRKDFDENNITFIGQKFFWNELNNYEFKINCKERDFLLLEKLFKNAEILDSILDLPRGIEIGGNSDKISEVLKTDHEKLLVGRDLSRYSYTFSNRFIKFENNISTFKNKEIYIQPKILIQRIRNLSLRRRIIAAYDDKSMLCTNTLRIGIQKNENFNLKFILAVLNSSTINYIFLKFFLNKDIYAYQLKTIPIKFVNPRIQYEFSDKVDQLINLNKQFSEKTEKFQNYLLSQFPVEKLSKKLQNWHELDFGEFIKELNKAINAANRERRKKEQPEIPKLTKKDEFEWMELFEDNKKKAVELQTQINQLDHQIDQMVYELYGLTEEEIAIVENS